MLASCFLFQLLSDTHLSHQAVQQEVASKQPDFDSLAMSAPHLEATQSKIESSATLLNNRYAALKLHAKVS